MLWAIVERGAVGRVLRAAGVMRVPCAGTPFAPGGQSLKSQLYAVCTVRAAFEWLTKVCYLAGNPCAAVTDPNPVKRARKLQIELAL
ncbi:hypothetical protein [Burkholderia ubonensis]|uniref:hypothetical protein n=1 Tax=Burkholderia ubonensis TaxID=101571 RepID=UPI00075B6E71|nr:hypothetical protein [Burkholderia ubonensis]KVT57219.1 hypothetical protein WK54_14785 [Burkholderia ubonensis]